MTKCLWKMMTLIYLSNYIQYKIEKWNQSLESEVQRKIKKNNLNVKCGLRSLREREG